MLRSKSEAWQGGEAHVEAIHRVEIRTDFFTFDRIKAFKREISSNEEEICGNQQENTLL